MSKFKRISFDIFKTTIWISLSLLLIFISTQLYNNIIEWLENDFELRSKIDYLFGELDMARQLAMPFFVGFIGSLATSMIMLLKGKVKVKIDLFSGSFRSFNWILAAIISSLIGGIAGIGAVNILNSDGSPTEVLVIALIAGLSGVSYLKGIALVNGTEENDIFIEKIEETIDSGELLIAQGAVELNEYADSWEEFIDTWIKHELTKYTAENPEHTDDEYNAYVDYISGKVNEIWKGDVEDE